MNGLYGWKGSYLNEQMECELAEVDNVSKGVDE